MQGAIKYITGFTIILLIASMPGLMAQDNESPLSPQLTLLSVDPDNGFSQLYWIPGGSPDVAAYVIYTYSEGQGEPVDTLFNPFATSYIFSRAFANSYSMEYVIAALDSSDNVSPLSNPLNTVYAFTELDTCEQKIILSWNEYNNFPFEVNAYSVYVSIDGDPEIIAGNTDAGSTTFTYENFEPGHTYCFRVEVLIEGGRISSSNKSCIETDIVRPPLWINGDYSKVDKEDRIELSFTYDADSEIELFRLEKAASPQGPFIPFKDINDNTGNIIVEAGSLEADSIYFRLSAINACNFSLISSNTITAIPIQSVREQKEIEIKWREYLDYSGGLSEYRIYRIMNGEELFIASNPAGDTIFRDHMDSFAYLNNSDNICYRLEAVELNNPFTVSHSSLSQIACLETVLEIFVPNAFTPDGDLLNDTFYPFIPFTPKRYRLFIKNRSGISVFSTSDYLEKWDGKHGGKVLQPDVYFWFIELTTPGGKEITRKGTVTIIFN